MAAIFSLFMVVGLITRSIYYHYKHKDERGWWKCVDCGDTPETIYHSSTFWGRVHRCDKCTKWDEL